MMAAASDDYSLPERPKEWAMETLLEVKGISKTFGGVKALQDVDLRVEKGQTCCLMGENGSGKSTLIKIISGVYTPDQGEIILNGKTYKKLTPAEAIREGVQIIYQDFSVFPNLSVAENIAFPVLKNNGARLLDRKKMRDIAAQALDRIQVTLPLDQMVEHLSVAGKQIVAIARGIIQDARLLIMDEPTTTLTYREIEALYSIIDGLRKQGVAVLFVSHKLEEVFKISERLVILRNGRKVLDTEAESFDKSRTAFYMTGREIPVVPYDYVLPKEGNREAPILQVKGLTMKDAFTDISFSLYPKEILGITGQLGCGRTELAKALFGIGRHTGSIEVNGKEAHIESIQDTRRYGIGYVPEDRLAEGLFLVKPLTDNITVSSIDQFGKGQLYQRKELIRASERWLNELEITAAGAQEAASTLSGGNQQRVVLAKWLATNPKILILNCPTVGVDIGSKNQIHEIIKDLARQDIGIIVISDDIMEILTVCSRILIMKNGRVTRQVNAADITAEELEMELITAPGSESGVSADEHE